MRIVALLFAALGTCSAYGVCTAADLEGEYAFELSGWDGVFGTPLSVVGDVTFDGVNRGRISRAIQSVLGEVSALEGGGRYFVRSDACMAVWNLGLSDGVTRIRVDIAIGDNEHKVMTSNLDDLTTTSGTAVRRSP